jgi:hypothetical protein
MEMPEEPSTLAEQNTKADDRVPCPALKIGGFLIIVAVGLVLSFIRNLESLAWALIPFREEVWEKLTIPGSSAYHPSWKTVLLFQIISASAIFMMTIIGMVLFFRKHRFFPTVIVIAIPLIFLVMLVSYYLEGLVPAIAASQYYAKEKRDLVMRFIALHVWIPYFVVSDRVKRTFVR